MHFDVDSIVAGAGAVGLAIGRELARHGKDVLVVERAAHPGSETSSRSSEVIHAGIYYPADSLKSRLCLRGRDLLYDYCNAKKIGYSRVGKLIVASRKEHNEILKHYVQVAGQTGVVLEPLSATDVRTLEPEIHCDRGLWSPDTGIFDSHEFILSLTADLEAAGGTLACHSTINGAAATAEGIEVRTEDSTITCRQLINSTGLAAPALARSISGVAVGSIPDAFYAIGHYYNLVGPSPFTHLVYPSAESGGLGVHVTLDLAGQARFGPDVRWIDRPDYAFDDSRRDQFKKAIEAYYPAIRNRELVPGHTGIRPKIVPKDQPAADFVISTESEHGAKGVVNLYGIESPGLTAALAIAELVREFPT